MAVEVGYLPCGRAVALSSGVAGTSRSETGFAVTFVHPVQYLAEVDGAGEVVLRDVPFGSGRQVDRFSHSLPARRRGGWPGMFDVLGCGADIAGADGALEPGSVHVVSVDVQLDGDQPSGIGEDLCRGAVSAATLAGPPTCPDRDAVAG